MPFMFEDLTVYQKAVDFADRIAAQTERFPRGYGFISDQLNRAALSITTNLAEGNGRFTKADRRSFFVIARGSVQEGQTAKLSCTIPLMRIFAMLLLAALSVGAAESAARPESAWPFWDEKESIEQYAKRVRLPTDAEWEHACRVGTKTTYYTGDAETDLDRAGWYGGNSKGATHPAGQREANAWGVYDMHGNVWEWCVDWFETYKAEAVVDPQGPPEGQFRVLRGGSWGNDPGHCRSANRLGYNPGYRLYGLGFRVVVVAAPRTP